MARLFLVCAVFAVLLATPAAGMFEQTGLSVRADGMGGAFVAIADDVGAVVVNPAGLSWATGMQFSSAYRLLFGGIGVNLHSGDIGFSKSIGRFGAVGLSVREVGYELHSERTVKLAHGFNLARDLSFGYALSGYNLYQRDVGSGYAFGLDLGMAARVYKMWSVGFSARNVNMPRIGVGTEAELPWRLAFGVGFSPAPGIQSAFDVEKEPGMGTRIAVGQEFRIIRNHLTLRVGLQTNPVRFSAGLRTGTEKLHVEYALRTHPLLPLEHDVGLLFEF